MLEVPEIVKHEALRLTREELVTRICQMLLQIRANDIDFKLAFEQVSDFINSLSKLDYSSSN